MLTLPKNAAEALSAIDRLIDRAHAEAPGREAAYLIHHVRDRVQRRIVLTRLTTRPQPTTALAA